VYRDGQIFHGFTYNFNIAPAEDNYLQIGLWGREAEEKDASRVKTPALVMALDCRG
jgi:hypothetical protein